jgi:hypothetical protein
MQVMFRIIAAMLLAGVLVTPAFSDDLPFQKTQTTKIGGWEIGTYTGKEDGRFYHCMANTIFSAKTYEQSKIMRTKALGLAISIAEVKGTEWMQIMIMGYQWNLTVGNKYQVKFVFDNNLYSTINVTATDKDVLKEPFPPNGEWYKRMMEAKVIEILIDDQSIGQFNMNKSGKALAELLHCYEQNSRPTFGPGTEQSRENDSQGE